MNKLLIASAIALASLAATTLPSQAASVVMVDDGPDYHHYHHYDHGDWDHHHHHHHHCYTERVTGWHHGHKVYREEEICR